jgi:hypothetical protein
MDFTGYPRSSRILNDGRILFCRRERDRAEKSFGNALSHAYHDQTIKILSQK